MSRFTEEIVFDADHEQIEREMVGMLYDLIEIVTKQGERIDAIERRNNMGANTNERQEVRS